MMKLLEVNKLLENFIFKIVIKKSKIQNWNEILYYYYIIIF
jgi:hypothetical protein